MPNYENGTIYKLCCKDIEVKEIYVGSTTSWRARKSQHKSRCTNLNDKKGGYPVYVFMRANGGWDNWDMVEIERYSAKDIRDLNKRERFWFDNLGATLNGQIPSRTDAEYYIDNKAKHNQQTKNNYLKNRDTILQREKEKRNVNRDEILLRQRETYHNRIKKNPEKYKEKRSEKITCECGRVIRRGDRARHSKSKIHARLIEQKH